MKKIFKLLFVALVSFLVLSCGREDDKVTLNITNEGKVSSNISTIVLDETMAESEAVSFTWTAPTFNPNVATTNYLELAASGTNFSPKKERLLEVGVNPLTLTHVELNTLLSGISTPDVTNEIEVRVRSEVNDANIYYSEIITMTITPYTPNPDLIYPKINVPGSYGLAAGYDNWSPSNTMNLYSPASNDIYRGFIYITSAGSEYKFTINQDWAGDKGDNGTFTGILVQDGESNIPAANPGTYYLNVDWAGNTYSSAVANFGMIGDATPTGWGSDTDFTYNPVTKKWEIASINLNTSGFFKFRANDDWAMKFQPASADETLTSNSTVKTFLSSEGTVNGDPSYKIDVAGNYKVVLDLHNSAYYNLTLIKL